MKNMQQGFVSLLSLIFASFLLSLGGAGSALAYFQKNPDDFFSEFRTYVASHVNAEELAPLDVTPTPTPDPSIAPAVTETLTPTPTPTLSITPTPTLTDKPSIIVHGGIEDDNDVEEGHESTIAKIHEQDGRAHSNWKTNIHAGINFIFHDN